ncbi:Glucose-1-phosphate adenylyltransferase [subsurface metagenome]
MLLFLEGGLKQFIQLLENDPSDAVIISTLNLISIIEEDALGALCKNIKGNIVKLSLNNTPVDIYMADRRKLIKELESFLYRNHKMKKFEETLFQEILHTSFDIIEDIPGVLHFHNNLMQMYRENLWLVANNGSRDHAKILSRLEGVKISDKQTLIGSSSHVKDSIISSGAHIEGYVEGSIIFSDVVVRKGARVVNSIVMNNNRIGAQAQIHNCLIFPSLAESARSIFFNDRDKVKGRDDNRI